VKKYKSHTLVDISNNNRGILAGEGAGGLGLAWVLFLHHKLPHSNMMIVCIKYSHGCSLFQGWNFPEFLNLHGGLAKYIPYAHTSYKSISSVSEAIEK